MDLFQERNINFYGHENVLSEHLSLSENGLIKSIIFGPPGVGKTTFAHYLGCKISLPVIIYTPSVEKLTDLKNKVNENRNKSFILFIDEVHRLDRKQQDYLLTILENAWFHFICATTEQPERFLTSALRSRVMVYEFEKLNLVTLKEITKVELKQLNLNPDQEKELFQLSLGDARAFKNLIQKIKIQHRLNKSWSEIRKTLSLNKVFETDRYYDLLSAIIKSLRDSSTDEALLYTSAYIHEGGDINQLLRRLIIFASEDIGNATPFALTFSNSVHESFQKVGMPEGKILIGQLIVYFARCKKSRSSYDAIKNAMNFVQNTPPLEIPANRLNRKIKENISLPNIKFHTPSGIGHDL